MSIIDSFEDGDMSEYNHIGSGGFSEVTTTRSYQGSQSLHLVGGASGNESYASSAGGLSTLPESGDVFRARVYTKNDDGRCRPFFGFFLPDSTGVPNNGGGADGYAVVLNHDMGEWQIVDGSSVLASESIPTADYDSEWVEYEVDTSGSDIVATLYDSNGVEVSTVMVNDTRWTSGEIGFRLGYDGSGDEAFFDGVETDSLSDLRVPSHGWYVAVEHPLTGRLLIPEVIDEDIAVMPSLNSLPEVRIPVRKNSVWLDPSLEENPTMAVFLDGERQPIDELWEVDDETSHTVLHGIGGSQLRNRAQAEFSTERRHIAARDLITSETGYAEDVDTPNTTSITGRVVQDTTGDDAFGDIIQVEDTDPIDVQDTYMELKQTCFISEAEDRDRDGSFGFTNQGQFSGGTALLLGNSDSWLEFDFTIDHTIPEEYVGLWIRKGASDDPPSYTISIDGIESESVNSGVGLTLGWNDYADGAIDFDDEWTGGPLEPGEHTVRIEIDALGSTDFIVDLVALVDNRYNYNFDNDNGGSGGYLDGPELYPDAVDISGADYETPFSVTRGAFEIGIDNSAGNQRIQVSNDRGESWTPTDGTENNNESIDETFTTTGATLRGRATIGHFSPAGSRDQTPRLGYDTQTIGDWTLTADMDIELLLIDQDYDDDLETILTSIAGEEFLWSYNLDADGNPQVSWTEPGQRTAERDPDIGDVSISKQLGVWPKVTVKGSNRQISGESFQASATYEQLNRNSLITGSETVYDPSGTNYERGADYEMDYSEGQIRTASSSDLDDGSSYSIDYDIEVSGSYTVDGAGNNPDEFVETVPSVNSQRGAEQIAYVLADEFKEPRYAGTLDIPRSDVTFDPLEALTLPNLDLPDAATPLEVRGEPEITPTGVRLRLGSRGKLENSLRQISDQLREVSQQS